MGKLKLFMGEKSNAGPASGRYLLRRAILGRAPESLVFFKTHLGRRDYVQAGTGIWVLPYYRFCQDLDLP